MTEYDSQRQEKLHEFVPFNPDHITYLGTLTVEVNGQETEIHDTNNLYVLVGAFFKLRNNERPSNPNQELYYYMLKDNNYNLNGYLSNLERYEAGLFFELERIDWMLREEENNRNYLRRQMEQGKVVALGSFGRTEPTKQQKIKRQYYFSQAFDALAYMAQGDDPDYDISCFVR